MKHDKQWDKVTNLTTTVWLKASVWWRWLLLLVVFKWSTINNETRLLTWRRWFDWRPVCDEDDCCCWCRLVSLVCSHRVEFTKAAPYIVADYCTAVQHVTLYPRVKVSPILSCCQSWHRCSQCLVLLLDVEILSYVTSQRYDNVIYNVVCGMTAMTYHNTFRP